VDLRQGIGLYHGQPGVPGSKIMMMDRGIGIESDEGMVRISSLSCIKLEVAGGTSSIILMPDQIIINGPMVFIN
jgi:hypothetical protein